jgi:hypothetical protein
MTKLTVHQGGSEMLDALDDAAGIPRDSIEHWRNRRSKPWINPEAVKVPIFPHRKIDGVPGEGEV